MYIFKLIRQFKAATGRSPTPNELSKLKQQAETMSAQDNIIQFPEGGIDSVPVDKQFGGRKSLKEFTEAEDAFEASKLRGNETFDELIDPTRIKGGISTRIKLNSFRENEQYAKDLIGGKSSEFNILKGDDRKEILDLLDEEITKGKTPPTSTDDMPFADGGRAGFNVGGIAKLLKFLQSKVGKKNITTADKIARPESALNREMFDEANKRFNKKVNERTSNKSLLKAMDEVGGNFTGDLKYDADVLADEIAFQRGLIPEGGDLTDIADQMKRMDLYDEAYSALSQQFLKQREIRKLSKPTKTLKSIEDTGTIDISDPNIADEFDTFLRENDPKGYKNLEQKIQLDTFDTKGRKKNAVGGLAYMLGEEPRSKYGGGGLAGAPPVTYDDNIDNIGPGPTMPPNTMMNTPAIDPRLFNQGTGTGVMIDQRGLQEGKIPRPTTQGLADGGRIGFKDGGMDRRSFLKLMGGLAALPVVGKFFKGAKVASKVVPLKGTTTTMPTWFPDLVDKFVAKGVGKKIDQDLMEYTTKELPGVKMAKSDNGKIIVEGKNEYGRPYAIEYEPPGYEVIDEVKGKAVKTKGDFRATDVVPESSGAPDDVPDFFPEQLDSLDDILSSDARIMEEFATGSKIKNPKRGEQVVGQAEVRLENAADEAAERMAEEADEFASGGLAKLLGE